MTLGKAYEIFVDLIVVAFIFSRVKGENFTKVWNANIVFLIAVIFYLVIYSIINNFILFRFDAIGLPVWRGYGHPNSLTQIGAIFALIAIVRIYESKRTSLTYSLLLLFGLVIIFLTRSRTSIFIFLFLSLLIVLLYRQLLLRNFIFLSILSLIVSFNLDFFISFILRQQTYEQFWDLSGRISWIWKVGFDVFEESPYWGYGFYYGTRIVAAKQVSGSLNTQLSNLDNTYLEILVNLGIVGFLPILILIFKATKKSIHILKMKYNYHKYSHINVEVALIILSTVMRGFFNPTFQYHHWNTILFLIAISYLYILKDQTEQKNQTDSRRKAMVSKV